MTESMQVDLSQPNPLDSIPAHLQAQTPNDLHLTLVHYISNYRGYTHYNRLILIALHYEALRGEALSLAAKYIKENTFDTVAYGRIFEILFQTARTATKVSPDDAEASATLTQSVMAGENVARLNYDKNWVENTRRTVTFKLEQLDTDLKNYQANSVKDNVRRVSDELGDLYLKSGNFDKALKCYLRSRDNCTSSFQELLSCINIIRVYIYQEGWPFVNANFAKGDSLIDPKDSVINRADPENSANMAQGKYTGGQVNMTVLTNKEGYAIAKSQLAIAGGLYQLTLGKYKTAAMYFIQVTGDYQESYNDILTTSDVINYASLCALASMDRTEIGRFVMGTGSKTKGAANQVNASLINNFKQVLETEPNCRDLLKSFYIADYSHCLKILDKLCRETLYLDCYLAPHLSKLVAEIRNKALCQYFAPYMSADLTAMGKKFFVSPSDLQQELAALIQAGKMKARIDSANGLLKALSVDQRKCSFAGALKQADEYILNSQKALLRMALAKAKLCVEPDVQENEEADRKYVRQLSKRPSGVASTASMAVGEQAVQMEQDFTE